MAKTEITPEDMAIARAAGEDTARNVAMLGERPALTMGRVKLEVMQDNAGPVVCEKGCAMCCYIPVALTMQEARLIADELRKRPDLDVLVARLREGYERIDGLGFEQLRLRNISCPFLKEEESGHGTCLVYGERPMTCRSMTSRDLGACQTFFDDTHADVPLPARIREVLAAEAVVQGLVGANRLQTYELRGLLLRLLTGEKVELLRCPSSDGALIT